MRVHRKSHMILLEVLLGLALLALCFLPLITPHYSIVKSHLQFNRLLEIDRVSSQLYVDFLERLQKNEIAWTSIQNEQFIPIEDSVWRRLETNNFKGIYQFQEIKHKTNPETGWGVYLYKLILSIETADAKGSPIQFPYTLTLVRHVQAVTVPKEKEAQK